MSGNQKLFLSAVSREFDGYRDLLAKDLCRPNLDVAVQDRFINAAGSTLEKLDDYIRACHGVVHLIGKATGAVPEGAALGALLRRYPDLGTRVPILEASLGKPQPGFSYTQWEAYLALYHGRPLFVYLPADFETDDLTVPRDPRFLLDVAEVESQKAHFQRLNDLGHDRGRFANEERLSSAVLRDLVEILPRLETTVDVAPTRLRHTAERLIGRDRELNRLDAIWNDPSKNLVVVRAFAGMGKTSLVAAWMAELANKAWRGAERVFDWSFYSQGTSDQRTASADTFIDEALGAFGDPHPGQGSPWEQGARLAHLIGRSRCLLVLDGLEPLQYPPGPMEGRLKDRRVEALLKGLCAHNKGLCLVTTREKVTDLQQHYGRAAEDMELVALTDVAGAALLHHHGARRAGAREIPPDDKELQEASREARGHGLTLQFLAKYLGLAQNGDVRKRDTVRLAEADRENQNDASRPYGHAFKAIEAYERWFEREGEQGQRQLAVLRLLGLFDRPASKGCIDVLRNPPVIAGLTDELVGLGPRAWRVVVHRLEEISLLSVNRDDSLDAHPLLREYFGQRLRTTQPQAWQHGHRRLYDYLCETTKEGEKPTLESLQPLYQAVVHGCQAGMQREAFEKVYFERIRRLGDYSWQILGAFGSDLGAQACFFDVPWSRVSPALTEVAQGWLLDGTAFCLRSLGRLTEAIEPMAVSGKTAVHVEDWKGAARKYGQLSQLELTMGEVPNALRDAEQSVVYADRRGDWDQRMISRTVLADALHQAGHRVEAEATFRAAEQMQAHHEPARPFRYSLRLLYSLQGFLYCDLLLTEAEQEAAKLQAATRAQSPCAVCHGIAERVALTLTIAERNHWLLDVALDHLTRGRATLYAAIVESRGSQSESEDLASPLPAPAASPRKLEESAATELELAVSGLRSAGQQDHLPRGLLSRAWLRSLTGPRTGADSAQSDLDEAWEIAERGPMPLFLADIHLYRARLFFRETSYPWEAPQHDLAEARRLIEKHGYLRRKEELEDAEAAILGKAPTRESQG